MVLSQYDNVLLKFRTVHKLFHATVFHAAGLVNPRRACARVTVVVLCVCLCVYLSVPALADSASVETSKQRYSRGSLRLFLDLIRGFSKKPSVQKLWPISQYAN